MSRFRNNTKKRKLIEEQSIQNNCMSMYNYFSISRYKAKYDELGMEEQLEVVRDALEFINELKNGEKTMNPDAPLPN